MSFVRIIRWRVCLLGCGRAIGIHLQMTGASLLYFLGVFGAAEFPETAMNAGSGSATR
jgi:hypothetical protein